MKKWECTVCGYVHEGDEPPEECPICSADKNMFVEITASEQNAAQKPGSAVQSPEKPALLASIRAMVLQQIVKYHLHPIAVHTPNGIVPMAVLFLFITAFLGFSLFETAALYSLVYVLIVMPAVLFTGYEMWQKRYRGAYTSIFKIKIGTSITTVFLLLILVIWRLVQPGIMITPSFGRWVFLGLACLLVAAVALAGHMGGKLVFAGRK